MNKRAIFKHILVSLSLYFIFAQLLMAQNEIRIHRSTFKAKNAGFWEAYQNVLDGDKLAKKGKGAIPMALNFYRKAETYNSACPELNYKIALCYLRTDSEFMAVTYLERAYQEKTDVAKDILFNMGRAYQFNLQFDKAIDEYNAYYNSLKRRDQEKESLKIYKYIDECKSGKILVEKPLRVVIKDLGDSLNSKYDDYNALTVHNDSLMYFTSRRPRNKKQRPDKLNYMFDEDIYTAVNKNGQWKDALYLTDRGFNTKHNDDIVWVSPDGKTRYLYDGFKHNGDILVSVLRENGWSHPGKIARGINSSATESSMCITADGQTMYFVSDRKDESFGGKDIFFVKKNAKGKWGRPQNAGKNINTPYDEASVFVTPDGNTLYFSSKGHNSMGGFDIFRSRKDANGNWETPENMGYPINTPDDELFYRPSKGEKSACFSSNRPGSLGGYDIYKAIFMGNEKSMLLNRDEQIIAYFEKPIPLAFAKIPGEMKVDSTSYLRGLITDKKTGKPLMARIDLIDTEHSKVVSTTVSDSFGQYRMILPQLKNYGVEITAKNYMFDLDVVKIQPSERNSREISRNYALNRVEVGSKLVLKNIYFDSGKSKLKPASYAELDKVVGFLKDNTGLKIEISGYTDNQGSRWLNQRLSELRAKAVVDYLIAHGIPQEQLVYKGYGPSQPIAPNTTAAGRTLNRRVEFKVLSKQ